MIAPEYFNNHIAVEGEIIVKRVPNDTGSVVVWNSSTKKLSIRTHAEIVSDLNVMTTNTDQNVEGAKWFRTSGGNAYLNHRLRIISEDGSNPGMVFYKSGANAGTLQYDGNQYIFTNSDTNAYGLILSQGYKKSGSGDNHVLLGGGGHKAVSDFALSSDLPNLVTKNTEQTITADKVFKKITTTDWVIPKFLAFPDASGSIPNYIGFYMWNSQWQVNWRDASNTYAYPLLDIDGLSKNATFYGNTTSPKFTTPGGNSDQWNEAYNSIGNYVTLNTDQGVTGKKIFYNQGQNFGELPLVVWGNNGSKGGIGFVKGGTDSAILNFDTEFHFTNNNNDGYKFINAAGVKVAGSDDNHVILGGGGNKSLDELMTTNTDQDVKGTKRFFTKGNTSFYTDNALMAFSNDGSWPAMTFYRNVDSAGQIIFYGNYFGMLNESGNQFINIKSGGFIKEGSSGNHFLTGDGGHYDFRKKEDDWFHSPRDFPQGTLIQTDVDYSQTYGDQFLLEMKGNMYGGGNPLIANIQGYIYNDTIIAKSGYSTLYYWNSIIALNLNGKLCFWFSSLSYWQGFDVKVTIGYGGLDQGKNRVVSVSDNPDPGGSKRVEIALEHLLTKEQLISGNTFWEKKNIASYWAIDSDKDVAVLNGNSGQRLLSGGLLASDGYIDAQYIPAYGIHAKGSIQSDEGFVNRYYKVNQRNKIWNFGDSTAWGLSYFQGNYHSLGEGISFHFGDAGDYKFFVKDNGNIYAKNDITAGNFFNGKGLYSPVLSGVQVIHAGNSNELYFGNPVVPSVYIESGNNNLIHNRSGYGAGIIWDQHNFNPDHYIPTSHPVYNITQNEINGWKRYLGYWDNRNIQPAHLGPQKLQIGFTNWFNNGDQASHYADYLHFGGYQDGSGGNQNLIMFSKDGFGLRQFQGSWQGVSKYQSYVDYWNTENFTQNDIDGWKNLVISYSKAVRHTGQQTSNLVNYIPTENFTANIGFTPYNYQHKLSSDPNSANIHSDMYQGMMISGNDPINVHNFGIFIDQQSQLFVTGGLYDQFAWKKVWTEQHFSQGDIQDWKNLASGNYVTIDAPQTIIADKTLASTAKFNILGNEYNRNNTYSFNETSGLDNIASGWIHTFYDSHWKYGIVRGGDGSSTDVKLGFDFSSDGGSTYNRKLSIDGNTGEIRALGSIYSNGDIKTGSNFNGKAFYSPLLNGNQVFNAANGDTLYIGNLQISNLYLESGNNDLFHNRAGNIDKIWDAHNFNPDLKHSIDLSGSINNGSSTRTNKSWFDYNWAETGQQGSVINFSGLNGNYSTELFASYNNPDKIGIRTKNGDNNTWNSAKWLWHSDNFNPAQYATQTWVNSLLISNRKKTYFFDVTTGLAVYRLYLPQDTGTYGLTIKIRSDYANYDSTGLTEFKINYGKSGSWIFHQDFYCSALIGNVKSTIYLQPQILYDSILDKPYINVHKFVPLLNPINLEIEVVTKTYNANLNDASLIFVEDAGATVLDLRNKNENFLTSGANYKINWDGVSDNLYRDDVLLGYLLTSQDIQNYVTLNTPQTIIHEKTFSGGLGLIGGKSIFLKGFSDVAHRVQWFDDDSDGFAVSSAFSVKPYNDLSVSWFTANSGGAYSNGNRIWDAGNLIPVKLDGGKSSILLSDIGFNNLNDLQQTGFFRGSNLINAPLNSPEWFFLICEYHYTGWVSQTATSYGTGSVKAGRTFKRSFTGGTAWTDWNEVITTLTFNPDHYQPIGSYLTTNTTQTIDVTKTIGFQNTIYSGWDRSSVNNPQMGPFSLLNLALQGAYPLYGDEEFRNGSNNIGVYNNFGNGTVTMTREAASDLPNRSGIQLRFNYNGSGATPGLGGFILGFNARPNAIFIQKFTAKLPLGYAFNNAENYMGDNASVNWLTSRAGTGKWETYVRAVICGTGTSFGNGGHVYVEGPDTAMEFCLAFAEIYEINSSVFSRIKESFYAKNETVHFNGGISDLITVGDSYTQKRLLSTLWDATNGDHILLRVPGNQNNTAYLRYSQYGTLNGNIGLFGSDNLTGGQMLNAGGDILYMGNHALPNILLQVVTNVHFNYAGVGSIYTFNINGVYLDRNINFNLDNSGINFYDGSKIYKKAGGGIYINRGNNGLDPRIENADGSQSWAIFHEGNHIPFKNLRGGAVLEEVSESGIYRQEGSTSGFNYTTTLNMNSSDGRQQLTIDRSGGGMKFRGSYYGSGNQGWSDWKDVIHSGNLTVYLNSYGFVTQSALNSQLSSYATLDGVQTFSKTNTFTSSPVIPNGTLGTHAVNRNQIQLSAGNEGENGQQLTISGNNSVNLTNFFVTSRDGSRNPDDIAPNSTSKRVRFDFAYSTTAGLGGSGNYAGIMTYSPWDGTSASTGDSSYQLAFANQTGVDGSGIPMLKIRKGINGSWTSLWYKFWTEADFNITNIQQWNHMAQFGLQLNQTFSTTTGYNLMISDDHFGSESGLVDAGYQNFVAGRVKEYYKYGSRIKDGFEGINYHLERQTIGIGGEADKNKVSVRGCVKATENFKSEEERADTIFIPNGNLASLRDEIVNDESEYSIRLDPHQYEIDSSGNLEIDDRNRLIHIIGEEIKMSVNFREIYPKQQIVIYNFDQKDSPMAVFIKGKHIYNIEPGAFMRLYVTKSLRVIIERQGPCEIIL